MSSILMLSPITGVGESLCTTRIFTGVRLFSCVTSKVGLQVLEPGVCFAATFELEEEYNILRLC